ncbi:hypothetical protein RVIR1_08020 [Candidatus Rickettsiella viridis]|uniref:Uncharacterized protein n=1 Tax=Candidatus Rickettsiella viridis TaxID=676208 RepID=A0A2Z5UW79_9COXI|nr:hypothetical protein RVIR1_08020 [Candidatus Rickettsiella viridis]
MPIQQSENFYMLKRQALEEALLFNNAIKKSFELEIPTL